VSGKWLAKAVVQKALSVLPFGYHLNTLLSERVLGTLPPCLSHDLPKMLSHIQQLRRRGLSTFEGTTWVEVGPGQAPTAALAFALVGVQRQELYDPTRYFHQKWLTGIVPELGNYLGDLAAAAGQRTIDVERRYRQLLKGVSLARLPDLGIGYHAPCDASHTPLRPATVDVVTTSQVLEHVPPDDLLRLLSEWKRILRPAGLMSHIIDHSDHFSAFDRDLSPVNFLRFREATWRLLSSGLSYCNRLRECQYLQMFEDAGFRILHVESTLNPTALNSLSKLSVAREFAGMSLEELAVTRSAIVVQVAG